MTPRSLWKRLRFWVVIYTGAFLVVAYTLIPKHADLWLQIRIQNQSWDSLKQVQLAVSDRSGQVLATADVDLSTGYDSSSNNKGYLTGSEGWYADVTEKMLEAAKDGLIVSISAPRCRPKEFEVSRRDIGSSYDFPRVQLGGHGTGFHAAAMHYQLYRTLDLDCERPAAG